MVKFKNMISFSIPGIMHGLELARESAKNRIKSNLKTMKTETVFKKGQKVFDHQFGWGVVENTLGSKDFPVTVVFNKFAENYTADGKLKLYIGFKPTLSFTEYTLEGFSQEPPIDYNEYIGKLGVFWGDYPYKMIGILKSFNLEKEYAFHLEEWGMFKNFKPLTEEQIKILEL